MSVCKNRLFNKLLFFSFVFFTISFFSHMMISFAATNDSIQQRNSKQIEARESISHIQIQQRQIINQLEGMEQKYVR